MGRGKKRLGRPLDGGSVQDRRRAQLVGLSDRRAIRARAASALRAATMAARPSPRSTHIVTWRQRE
jgi:hypothetical protein